MDQEAGTALIKYVLLKYNQERTICVHGHGVIGAPSTVVPPQKGKTSPPRRRDARAKKPKPGYNGTAGAIQKPSLVEPLDLALH